ncbi:hypothetical protein COO60DRAFT_1664464 [Scenedesmus sp. NREL 46B-D3]|nr:hypothetical protein COO60DRAFT_1664464 [Scenedesmus sp. NREL 46B-D3]
MSELKDLLPVALHRAAGAAAGQLQQRVNGSAQRLAELQQLLQANEAALSAEASTHQTTRTSLAELQKRLAENDAELYSSKSKYNQLKVDLEGSNKKCQGLQRQLQVKEKELAALNVELDSTQADLEDAKCRGQELLTFQGAESKMQQLNLHGLMHAVLAEAACHVFGTFRTDNLMIGTSSSPYDEHPVEATLLLQLLLEKNKALSWLQLVNADSSSMQGQYFGAQVVEKSAESMAMGLLHSTLLEWRYEAQDFKRSIYHQLLPAVRQVAAAAIRAQVVCSCMHTQLVQLHVPGWKQSSPGGVAFGDAAPDAWSRWPGIVPFGSAHMQVGAALRAAAEALPTGIAAAAVYCMEPAVIHVAERMGQLVTQVPDARMQPFRVIRKAKVCVAQPAK